MFDPLVCTLLAAGSPRLPHVLPSIPVSSSCHPRNCFKLLSDGLQKEWSEESNVLCSNILSMGCGNQRRQKVTDPASLSSYTAAGLLRPHRQKPHRASPLEAVVNLVSLALGDENLARGL